MANTVILQWTDKEATALVASRGVAGATIESVHRHLRSEGDGPTDLAKTYRELIGSQLASKPKVVVLVGGSAVQYRPLTLPPAPLDELIDMVAMQAEGEFASTDDGSLSDFAVLSGGDTSPNEVLLARLSSKASREIGQVTESLGVEVAHLVPIGVATSWFARQLPDLATGNHLLVAPGEQVVDFALLHDGSLSLGRRFDDADEGLNVKTLVTPIRRTLAAAAGQLAGGPIRSLGWLGSLSKSDAAELSAAIGISVEPVDIADVLRSVISTSHEQAELDGFAAHAGALATIVSGGAAIDFANPKKHSEPPSRRRQWILAAAAAIVCVAAPAWVFYNEISSKHTEAERLEKIARATLERAEEIDPQVERANAIEAWQSSDIAWLDELDYLSQRIRPLPLDSKEYDQSGDVIATSIVMKPPVGNPSIDGVIEVKVAARDGSSFETIESSLRDDRHDVSPTNFVIDPKSVPFSAKTDEKINVQRRETE